jgi:hypothetical protein
MSGNRISLKNGLFVAGALLLTSLCSYGLNESQVAQVKDITQETYEFMQDMQRLKDDNAFFKNTKKDPFFGRLATIIADSKAVLATIPDIPKADKLLKGMLNDMIVGLERTHGALTTNSNFVKLKQWLLAQIWGGDCSLKPMLDKTARDLNELIEHVQNNPDEYTGDVVTALKTYKATTFKKFYDRWHKVNHQDFMALAARALALK